MTNIKPTLLLLAIPLIFLTCNKESTDISTNTFVDYSTSQFDYQLVNNFNNYSESFYYSSSYLAGGFTNNEYTLRNSSYTPLDCFYLQFKNLDMYDIGEGYYDFVQRIDDTESESGVEIIWMTNDEWRYVIFNYKQTQEYKDCVEYFGDSGESVCANAKLNRNDFYSTKYIIQKGSFFKVNTVEYQLFKRQSGGVEYETYEAIIEGEFKCLTRSQLDTAHVKSIEGEFRVHLPSRLSVK